MKQITVIVQRYLTEFRSFSAKATPVKWSGRRGQRDVVMEAWSGRPGKVGVVREVWSGRCGQGGVVGKFGEG